MKANPFRRLLALIVIAIAVVAIAAPVASASPYIGDDPGAVPASVRSPQSGKGKTKKTGQQRGRPCPPGHSKVTARACWIP